MRLFPRFILKIIFNRTTVIILLTALLVSAWFISCGNKSKPNLKHLFAESMMVTDQPPVVFIHGVLGSKLRDQDTNDEVWIGSTFNLLFGNHEHLSLEIDPDTLNVKPNRYLPFAIADKTAGKDFYGNIIKTLSEYGGYKKASPGQKIDPSKKYYYPFIYDWRQDNVKNAAQLADFIDQIREDYADPDLKVDIVAHSMGGLISRYYLRYGRTDVTNDNEFPVNMYGAERLRRIILLGTPNLGSVKMMNAFINGINVGFSRIDPDVLMTMPSLYQMLPHPLNNWIINTQGQPLDRDLFDINTWRSFRWNIFSAEIRQRIQSRFESVKEAEEYLNTLEEFFNKSIERARRFVWSLTVPLPENHPTLIVFGGDCTLTPARVMVEEVNGESVVRMYPDEIQMPRADVDYEKLLMEPGDGSVTKASLLGRNVLDLAFPDINTPFSL